MKRGTSARRGAHGGYLPELHGSAANEIHAAAGEADTLRELFDRRLIWDNNTLCAGKTMPGGFMQGVAHVVLHTPINGK